MYKPNTYIFAYTIVHAATVGSPHLDRSAVPLRCLQMLYPDTTDYHSVFYCSVVVCMSQNEQARVHVSPSSIRVDVPEDQHS